MTGKEGGIHEAERYKTCGSVAKPADGTLNLLAILQDLRRKP